MKFFESNRFFFKKKKKLLIFIFKEYYLTLSFLYSDFLIFLIHFELPLILLLNLKFSLLIFLLQTPVLLFLDLQSKAFKKKVSYIKKTQFYNKLITSLSISCLKSVIFSKFEYSFINISDSLSLFLNNSISFKKIIIKNKINHKNYKTLL